MARRYLILGGARSGKSSFAEQLATTIAAGTHTSVTLIATAQALDEEMQQRIIHHQENRDRSWQLCESPLQLGDTINKLNDTSNQTIIVDCLTLWLTNCLCHCESEQATEQLLHREKELLLASIQQCNSPLIIVSNEVGQGVVPSNALARRFIDEAGWLHQAIAKEVEEVYFVTAGIPQQLKSSSR